MGGTPIPDFLAADLDAYLATTHQDPATPTAPLFPRRVALGGAGHRKPNPAPKHSPKRDTSPPAASFDWSQPSDPGTNLQRRLRPALRTQPARDAGIHPRTRLHDLRHFLSALLSCRDWSSGVCGTRTAIGSNLPFVAVFDPQRTSTQAATRAATRTSLHTASADRRHSYATNLLDAGVPIEIVSRLLGHESIFITDAIYNHQRTIDFHADVNKLANPRSPKAHSTAQAEPTRLRRDEATR